ncbi:hypothetical protein U0070_007048, partial [Myodes glareolus]
FVADLTIEDKHQHQRQEEEDDKNEVTEELNPTVVVQQQALGSSPILGQPPSPGLGFPCLLKVAVSLLRPLRRQLTHVLATETQVLKEANGQQAEPFRQEAQGSPLVGDVLEHCDRDAEEGNEQITECQRADEDVGDCAHGFAAGHHIDYQRVAKERQGKNECSHQRKSQFSPRWQLGSVNQRPQPVEMNELLPSQIVRTQQPGELLRVYRVFLKYLSLSQLRTAPSQSPILQKCRAELRNVEMQTGKGAESPEVTLQMTGPEQGQGGFTIPEHLNIGLRKQRRGQQSPGIEVSKVRNKEACPMEEQVNHNEKIVVLLQHLKPEIKDVIEQLNVITTCLQLQIPQLEGGNNCGVAVQEKVFELMTSLHTKLEGFHTQTSKYFSEKGDAVTKSSQVAS